MRKGLLSDIQKGQLYKSLASKSLLEAGLEFGLEKHYSSKVSIRGVVKQVAMEVEKDPEKFAISGDVIELVKKAAATRKEVGKPGPEVSLYDKEKTLAYTDQEVKELVASGAKKAWVLLNRRLDYALTSKKKVEEFNVGALVNLAGMSFDKNQITKGEATEHIALQAKLSDNLTPQERLSLILAIREQQTSNEKKAA